MMAGWAVEKAVHGLIWWLSNWPNVMAVVLGGFLLLMPVFVVMIFVHIFFGRALCPGSNSAVGCVLSLMSSVLQYAATALAETTRRW